VSIPAFPAKIASDNKRTQPEGFPRKKVARSLAKTLNEIAANASGANDTDSLDLEHVSEKRRIPVPSSILIEIDTQPFFNIFAQP
jgi:ribosomal protein L22